MTYSPAGPDDFRNMFLQNYFIYENGKLIVYTEPGKRLKIDDNAPVYESELSKKEVDQVKTLIEQNKFWKFKEDLTVDSEDGAFLYMTVKLTNESKKVGGLNPNDLKFKELTNHVIDLVNDKDYEFWKKEITNHIYKMNPE